MNGKKSLEGVLESNTINPQFIREDIERIREASKPFFENCETEQEAKKLFIEEILTENKYLQSVNPEEDLDENEEIKRVGSSILAYYIYNRMLELFGKSNNRLLRDYMEKANKMEEDFDVAKSFDDYLVRELHRISNINDKKTKIENIKKISFKTSQTWLISNAQYFVSFLNEYGYLDEDIETANKEFENAGFNFMYEKRNPVADEEFSKGKEVKSKDRENAGVIDCFETENLEKFTLADLMYLNAFWTAKGFEAKASILEGLYIINDLDLWDKDKDVSDEQIKDASTKYFLLNYLYNAKSNKEQLYSEVKDYLGMDSCEFEKELEKSNSFIRKSTCDTRKLLSVECLFLQLVEMGVINIKKWGKLEQKDNNIIFVFENKWFTIPLTIVLPESIIKKWYSVQDVADINFPKYKGKAIDPSKEFSSLLLPINTRYSEAEKTYAKENRKKDEEQEAR